MTSNPAARWRHRANMDGMLVALGIIHWIAVLVLGKGVIRIDHLPEQVMVLAGFQFALLAPAGIVLLAFLLVRWRTMQPSTTRTAVVLSSGLTTIVTVSIALYPWHPSATANLLYLAAPAPAAALALTIAYRIRATPTSSILRDWAIIAVAFSVLYAWMGFYFTMKVGQHSGDEGHYIIQAESLYHDGDLDIRNNFPPPPPDRGHIHISPNSRDGKWYSWHTPGLSFLIAPTMASGVAWRHAILGLVAGLAIAGTYALGRVWGADRRSALIATAALAIGPFWCIYASRTLPEVLGAGLATYAMLAVFRQRSHPWVSVVASAACIAFLPWAHTRFIPVAVTVFGCYGLHGLFGPETWLRKFIRLGLYTLLVASSFAGYQVAQHAMFIDGLSYPVPDLLFSQLSGWWHTMASSRGILYMLPVFACGLAAALRMMLRSTSREAGSYVLLVFLSVWLTACGTRWFTGGACMPGRFLLVTTPLFMACLAVALTHGNGAFRHLTGYLALFPAALFLVELTVLERFGKAFSDPLLLERVHPLFPELLRFYYNPYESIALMPAGLLYAAACFFLLVPRAGHVMNAILCSALVAAYALHAYTIPRETPLTNPRVACTFLQQQGTANLVGLFMGNPPASGYRLTDGFNRFHGAAARDVMSLTSRDLGEPVSEGVISEPRLTPNDWDNRGYRWATLVTPFRAGETLNALRVEAENTGQADVEFVVREGSHTRMSVSIPAGSSLNETMTFATRDNGDLYILARFIGSGGEFTVSRIAFSPYPEWLARKTGLEIE